MITEDYVSFETAKLLKEKGFDEECCRFWQYDKANNKDDTDGISLSECNVYLPLCNSKIDYLFKDKLMSYGYSAPTLQMAMKWLRNVHGLFIHIDIIREASCWLADIQDIKDDVSIYPVKIDFPNYEEACEGAIKYCIENLI